MSNNIKMKTIHCTQCGAQLEADLTKETAQCPYCGTTFFVENIKKEQSSEGSGQKESNVKTVLGFIGNQMSESRKYNHELKKQQMIEDRKFMMTAIKVLPLMMIVMLIIGVGLQKFGFFEDSDTETVSSSVNEAGMQENSDAAQVNHYVENGLLYVDIKEPSDNEWRLEDFETTLNLDESFEDGDGYHFVFSIEQETGTGYAVIGQYEPEEDEPVYYAVFNASIDQQNIVSVDSDIVDSLSDYSF